MKVCVLKYWYTHFNKRFFGGELPDVWVHYRNLPGTIVGRTYFQFKTWKPYELVISSKLKRKGVDSFVITILLHEMAHISIGGRYRHGKRFWNEIDRLYEAGAYTKVRGGVL